MLYELDCGIALLGSLYGHLCVLLTLAAAFPAESKVCCSMVFENNSFTCVEPDTTTHRKHKPRPRRFAVLCHMRDLYPGISRETKAVDTKWRRVPNPRGPIRLILVIQLIIVSRHFWTVLEDWVCDAGGLHDISVQKPETANAYR